MTESEWKSTSDALAMIDTQLLWDRDLKVPAPLGRLTLSDRKLRLFACACWRARFKADRAAVAADVADDIADVVSRVEDGLPVVDVCRLKESVWLMLKPRESARMFCSSLESYPGERRDAADAIRDVAGNPFRGIFFDDAGYHTSGANTFLPQEWRTPDVMSLAEVAYRDRMPDGSGEIDRLNMTVLADALMDAGCGDDAILDHLCAPRLTHHRGCWVLDAVLGKE